MSTVDSLTSVTDVKWSFMGDDDWIDFNKKVNLNLENTFHLLATKKNKDVKVDKERYIDFSLTPKEIRKNFNMALDCEDEELVGMQRRYDDKNKRRAVKRSVPKLFFKKWEVFVAIDINETVNRVLTTYGATIHRTLKKTTKVVITIPEDADAHFHQDVDAAIENKIPVVNLDWIVDSVQAGECQDPKSKMYQFVPKQKKRKPGEMEAPPVRPKEMDEEATMEIEEPAPPPKKKVEEPPSKLLEPPKKKTKVDSGSSGTIDMAVAESSGLPITIDVPSTWMGVCSSSEDYPFRMEIHSFKAKKITGVIHWPTLNGAQSKIRGSIEGNEVKFEEYEAITGEEEIQIPTSYVGTLGSKGKQITGKTVPDPNDMDVDDDDHATFQLDLVETDDDVVSGGNSVIHPFSFQVTKRTGNIVTGVVHWKGFESKFKATATAKGLIFDELTAIPGNPTLDLARLQLVTNTKDSILHGKTGSLSFSVSLKDPK